MNQIYFIRVIIEVKTTCFTELHFYSKFNSILKLSKLRHLKILLGKFPLTFADEMLFK